MEYAILAGMIALLGKELIVAYGRTKKSNNPDGKAILNEIRRSVERIEEIVIRLDERIK